MKKFAGVFLMVCSFVLLISLTGCKEVEDISADAVNSYDNLKNGVTEAKENVENTVQGVQDTVDNVKDTVEGLSETAGQVKDAADGVSEMLQ